MSIQSFEAFYWTHYGRLLRFIYVRLNDYDLANEVVSDAFLKTWEKKEELLSPNHLKAYLFRTAHNCTIDIFRKNHRRQLINLATLHESDEVADDENASYDRDINRLLDTMLCAVEKLPPGSRQVIKLKLEGHTIKWIAEQLGKKPSTVYNLAAKGIKKLAAEMGPLLKYFQ